MRRLIICLCVFSMALVTSVSYAENDMVYGPIDDNLESALPLEKDGPYGELSPATTIILCRLGQGNDGIQLVGELAITSFTETAYDKVRNEKITIRRYSNIRYDGSHEVVDYTIHDEIFAILAHPVIEERITRGPEIDSKLVDPKSFNIGYVIQRTPITIKNRLGSVILGCFYGTFYPTTKVPIGIVIGYPEDDTKRIEVSDVVISDLSTGQTFAVVDKVEMGYDNKAILKKLDEIHEDIERNQNETIGIRRLLQRVDISVKRIYTYINRTYRFVRRIYTYTNRIYKNMS